MMSLPESDIYQDQRRETRAKLFDKIREVHGVELLIMADGGGDHGEIDQIRIFVPQQYTNERPYINEIYPAIGYQQQNALLEQRFTPEQTVDEAICDFAWSVLDDNTAPDWINDDGGRVEIRVDLTVPEPQVTVTYELLVTHFEPGGVYRYDALSGTPHDAVPLSAVSETAELLELQSLWADQEDD